MVESLSYLSLLQVLHNWSNKGHGMCCLVCGMVYMKDPLLLIRKSIPGRQAGRQAGRMNSTKC